MSTYYGDYYDPATWWVIYPVVDSIIGSEGDDIIYGYYLNDTLIGAGGDDYIVGSFGDNFLDGGDGNDKLN